MDRPSTLTTSLIDEEFAADPQVEFDFAAAAVAAPDPAPSPEPAVLPGQLAPTIRLFEEVRTAPEIQRQSFGEWLIAQTDRKGWVGDLAKAAKADRDFPRRASPADVRARLQKMGADGDVFEALDDAELDWASY